MKHVLFIVLKLAFSLSRSTPSKNTKTNVGPIKAPNRLEVISNNGFTFNVTLYTSHSFAGMANLIAPVKLMRALTKLNTDTSRILRPNTL